MLASAWREGVRCAKEYVARKCLWRESVCGAKVFVAPNVQAIVLYAQLVGRSRARKELYIPKEPNIQGCDVIN